MENFIRRLFEVLGIEVPGRELSEDEAIDLIRRRFAEAEESESAAADAVTAALARGEMSMIT